MNFVSLLRSILIYELLLHSEMGMIKHILSVLSLKIDSINTFGEQINICIQLFWNDEHIIDIFIELFTTSIIVWDSRLFNGRRNN